MKVGVLGLGHMGLPIARSLHERDHEVFTWSRTKSQCRWTHSTSLETLNIYPLDYLIIASGSARPALGDVRGEIMSTYDLVPTHFEKNEPRVIYLSSGAVYGECINLKSEVDLINPSTEYGLAKLATEQAFFSRYRENFCALRIGNVIDWNSPYGVLQAMSKALSQHRMVFYGNPTDCRDYISIQDLTLTVSKIIELDIFPSILNVGSGKVMQLFELATILREGTRNQIEITWQKNGVGQLRQTKLEVSKMKSTFGVMPKNPTEIFAEFLSQGLS